MTEPHTSIVKGDHTTSTTLLLARALDALCIWLESEERTAVTLRELRDMANAGYERAGPVEERR